MRPWYAPNEELNGSRSQIFDAFSRWCSRLRCQLVHLLVRLGRSRRRTHCAPFSLAAIGIAHNFLPGLFRYDGALRHHLHLGISTSECFSLGMWRSIHYMESEYPQEAMKHIAGQVL